MNNPLPYISNRSRVPFSPEYRIIVDISTVLCLSLLKKTLRLTAAAAKQTNHAELLVKSILLLQTSDLLFNALLAFWCWTVVTYIQQINAIASVLMSDDQLTVRFPVSSNTLVKLSSSPLCRLMHWDSWYISLYFSFHKLSKKVLYV